MGGALLAIGGNTVEEAREKMAAQLNYAASLGLWPRDVARYAIIAAAVKELPPDTPHEVVDLAANVDWDGKTWPVVVCLNVHS